VLTGILLMIVTQFFSASVFTAVKVASKRVPTAVIVETGYIICLVLICLIIVVRRGPSLKTPCLKLQLLRSVSAILFFAGIFVAVKYIPVVDGVVMRCTAPIWVPLVVLIWLGRRVKPSLWLGIGAGFIGVAMIVHPTFSNLNKGYVISLLAAVSYAVSSVATRLLNLRGEPLLRTVFYAFVLPPVAFLPFAYNHFAHIAPGDWLLMGFVGVGTMGILFCFVSSLRYASPVIILPLTYVGVVIAGFYDWLLWGHIPSLLSLLGMVVVFFACTFIVIKGQ
jgi:drug/metabolite transporter (DMT)-like permease